MLTVIMLHAQSGLPEGQMVSSILAAWGLTAVVFLGAKPIYKIFTEKGLIACQRLIGLIVAIVAIQAVVVGLQGLCQAHG